ncbi:FACT complex subunit SPT16 [Mycena venus]|uniref:FACT complex subunit n=1 Tax=Mycena venus TaxID=2733690 RepID=A0A8H7D742_9AGAR|nr:FACT complex subunit SPT16 [Mycena venus]
MSTIKLDEITFQYRAGKLYDNWRNAEQRVDCDSIAATDALFLVAGNPVSEDSPLMGTLVQQWLLGYEFPSTFILFEDHRITILCSPSKGGPRSSLSWTVTLPPGVPIEILELAKEARLRNKNLRQFFALYASKRRVGVLREVYPGCALIDEWKDLLADATAIPEFVDMSAAFSALMATD